MPYCISVGTAISRNGLEDVQVFYDWDDSPTADLTGYYLCILDVRIGERSIIDSISTENLAMLSKRAGKAMIDNPPTPEERATNDTEMAENRGLDPVHALIKAGNLDGLVKWNAEHADWPAPILHTYH